MSHSATNRPVHALYVHVPFCQTICGYCDFYSTVLDPAAVGGLIDALLTELTPWRADPRLRLRTIFVGGGTPTVLPAGQLQRLLAAIGELPRDRGALEFTVEANPATVTAETADVLAQAGVNRVSIGAQSFDRSELRVLDRIHNPPQVRQTADICRAAGIQNLNLDLIFAIPGQRLEAWESNVSAALALRPEHLSCYGLTYERGTPLYERLQSGRVTLADSELESSMYERTIDLLAAAGLEQYEISNFARPGRECRHNLIYWSNEAYVGVGPSASGYVDGVRYKNVPDTAEYVRATRAGRPVRVQQEQLGPDATLREAAMLALRLRAGIDRAAFAERFGRDPAELLDDALRDHAAQGLLEIDDRRIRLSRAGQLVADTIIAGFL